MLRIEELKPNLTVTGIIPNAVVRILAVETMGESCSVVYRSPDGQLGDRMVFRTDEAGLSLAEAG